MLNRNVLTIFFVGFLAQSQAIAASGQARFDLAQVPGSYVVQTHTVQGTVQVQVKIDRPDVLNKALANDPPDSSPGDPTLDIDDGETLGPHTLEVDLITDCDHASNDRSCDAGLDTIVGIGDHVQINAEKFVMRDHPKGTTATTSVSATNVGIKYNFLNKDGWAMAVYPSVDLNDATNADGQVVYLPIMVSKQLNPLTTAAAEVGVSRDLEHRANHSTTMLIAIGRAVSETAKVLAEVESDRAPGDNATYVRVGYMKIIMGQPSSHYRLSMFSALARTVGRTSEGHPRYSIRLGLAVNLQPSLPN